MHDFEGKNSTTEKDVSDSNTIPKPMMDPWDDCIFTYIWLNVKVHVGKYTNPMDPMGNLKGAWTLKPPFSTKTPFNF